MRFSNDAKAEWSAGLLINYQLMCWACELILTLGLFELTTSTIVHITKHYDAFHYFNLYILFYIISSVYGRYLLLKEMPGLLHFIFNFV